MLRIGDFSKIARVSVRMLRHYDQIGLLKPANIDAVSGYRSYSVDQLPRLNRILFLKDLGFSLNEIVELIDDNISVEDMKTMLKKRQNDLENQISIAQLNLKTVMDRLRIIEDEHEIPKYDIAVKSTESFSAVTIRDIVPDMKEIGTYCHAMYVKLYNGLKLLKIPAVGPEITFYYHEEYCETDLDTEVGIVIQGSPLEVEKIQGSELTYRKLAAEDRVASLVYTGSCLGMEEAIIELLTWIGANGWEIVGELRAIHRSGPTYIDGQLQDPTVVELQIPIKRR